MKLILPAWTELKAESIAKCWRSAGITEETSFETTDSDTQYKDINGLVNTVVAAPARMSVREIMSADNEDIF